MEGAGHSPSSDFCENLSREGNAWDFLDAGWDVGHSRGFWEGCDQLRAWDPSSNHAEAVLPDKSIKNLSFPLSVYAEYPIPTWSFEN